MITTGTFKTEASTLARMIMARWVKKHIIALAFPPLMLLFLGTLLDLRLVVVALMIIFVIIPPIMMIVYFYHALSPYARYSILPHSLAIDNDGITFNYSPIDEETPARLPETIKWDKIKSIRLEYGGFTLSPCCSEYSIIHIPKTAFDSQKKMHSAINFIAKNLHS